MLTNRHILVGTVTLLLGVLTGCFNRGSEQGSSQEGSTAPDDHSGLHGVTKMDLPKRPGQMFIYSSDVLATNLDGLLVTGLLEVEEVATFSLSDNRLAFCAFDFPTKTTLILIVPRAAGESKKSVAVRVGQESTRAYLVTRPVSLLSFAQECQRLLANPPLLQSQVEMEGVVNVRGLGTDTVEIKVDHLSSIQTITPDAGVLNSVSHMAENWREGKELREKLESIRSGKVKSKATLGAGRIVGKWIRKPSRSLDLP